MSPKKPTPPPPPPPRAPYGVARLPDGRVEMWSKDLVGKEFKVIFVPGLGGTPLVWTYDNKLLIENYGGSGVNCTWETGQDYTQAGFNGAWPYSIGDPYYVRETLYAQGSRYETEGYYPAFWGSHEAIDDAMPAESAAGWRVKYLSPESEWPDFLAADSPCYWAKKPAGPTAGILYLGNEMISGDLPWYTRIINFAGGNLCARMSISFRQASVDAYAGFLINNVPQAGSFPGPVPSNVSQGQAYNAPGYMIIVNKGGGYGIHYCPTGAIVKSGMLPAGLIPTLNSVLGGTLEVRTHCDDTNFAELWFNGTFITEFKTDARGTNVGIIGSCSTGQIRFGARCVIDRNFRLSMSARALPEGKVSISYSLLKDPAAQGVACKLYRLNLPVMFLERTTYPSATVFLQHLGEAAIPAPWLPILKAGDIITCVQAGQPTFQVEINDLRLNGGVAAQAHGLLAGQTGLGQPLIHFNNLPESANQTPVLVESGMASMVFNAI